MRLQDIMSRNVVTVGPDESAADAWSRMQHRGTPRRRVVIVSAETALPPSGTTITANEKAIGALGTVQGRSALAIVRIDKAGEAMANEIPLLAGEVAVSVVLPEWTGLTFPTSADEASA